ncbi:MAG: arsenic efflux protein [Clostridia bacterium]|nr:arsenic efflux protein [Clostridia bacterium]
MWWEVILDALKDTAILFPFLFLMYIVIELLEHKTSAGKPNRALAGKCAPILGSALGTVPMCGFSVMAAKLYRNRHITLGTLLAVFIATSDEALLVLLTTPVLMPLDKVYSVLAMAGVKFVLGFAVGYLADVIFTRNKAVEPLPAPCEHGEIPEEEHEHMHEHESEHDHSEHVHEHEHEHEHYDACKHAHKSKVNVYLVSPLLHALQVAAFVLLVNLAFGYLFFALGEENVVAFLRAGKWIQPLVCSLIGLIPNCASSVVLAETFAVGGIEFGSCMAGLVTNAGLGILVLFKGKKELKNAALITLFMYLFGVAVGYAVNAFALLI